MKKRLGIICLILATTVSMLGCSDKAETKKKVTAEDDPEKIFQEAMEKLDKETLKAAKTQSVTSYSDGTEEEEFYTAILDTKKGIIERISKDADEAETIYHTFNVKEKDGYGVYVNDELTGGEWKYYKENIEDDTQSEYEYWLNEFNLAYTEENGYSNIKFSNEGEEELSGTEVIKIKVTADQLYDSGEESEEEITRESVLKEYEWNEDDVALVDGFSEILDNYVTASKESEGETTVQCALTVWISASDHTLLKSRAATNMESAQSDEAKAAIETFNEEYWKVDMVHQNIEDGMTREEAKKELEEDLAAMGNPTEETTEEASGEEFDEDEGTEEYAEVTKVAVTKKIMTGDECPKMSDLPKDYEKITQEEYFEGGFEIPEDDEYFLDEGEYEDEFE